VYPRSFADADGDGIGDIAGIRLRLSYLKALCVDAIWLTPWYRSPLRDGGYDVVDYRDIEPRFGTLIDAEALIAEAHEHDLRVIVDLVPNHTSSEHAWFRAALEAEPGSRERARYLFRPGRGDSGTEPPNDWTSVFGGPAWTRTEDGEWYLHLFDASQPDLDWDNEEVRAEFDDILRFWLARGVDGFRIDVAHGMVKDRALPDLGARRTEVLTTAFPADHPHWDQHGIHEINRRFRSVLDASGRDVMMVAEAWVTPERLALYLRDNEYHQSFNFDLLKTDWSSGEIRAAIVRALDAATHVGSTPTWTLSNHDVMRHATRYGLPPGTDWQRWPVTGPEDALDAELGLRRARAAALLLLALPGSVYLYQGEELGLPEVWDLPPEVLDDPVWESSGRTMKGRDGCRVPIPWTKSGPSFGFGASAPWLPQPDVFGALSVESQKDRPDTMLTLYQRALALRRAHFAADEVHDWIDLGDEVIAFRRGSGVICVVSFGRNAVRLPEGEVLLASVPGVSDTLPSDAAVWVRPFHEKAPS
jgi:alpha-glucosidase